MILGKVRRLARKFGLEAYRANYLTISEFRIVHFLQQQNICCLLDVGANSGQFATSLFSSGYKGRIISFEPLPDAHRELVAAGSRRVNWDVAPRFALGAVSGMASFHIAGNSVSSSLFVMSDTHVMAQPISRQVDTIEVQVRRLDDVIDDFGVSETGVFLKLDTQGAERDVLDGAQRTLERVTGLILELSLIELYQGQAQFDQLHSYIRGLGFELWDLVPGFRDPKSARLLQVDGIYFRPER